MEIVTELDDALFDYYLPYAKTTIVSRALCAIDGFKPVQRRILVTMVRAGLINGDRVKSQKINGATMSLHPNGDSSIYESLVLMSKGYNAFNVPYINSKGSFGAKYSRDLKYSAPRYTEVKLEPICKELFDGINENAVDMVPNFDGTDKEPVLLPVKFPTIMVNTSAGIAVGTSSNIPSFSLVNVCRATQGMLKGTIKNAADLAKVLGVPEFTTGGFVHADEKSLVKLCETGRGSFVISGKVEVYVDRIVITEIPYCTTAEEIIEAIEDLVKDKKLRGVTDVLDEIGKDGLKITVLVKKGYSSRQLLAELCRMTTLRTSISFRTRVIINDRCRELGLYDLMREWIKFRNETLIRQYTFRVDKKVKEEHLLKSWEAVVNDLDNLTTIIMKNTDAAAKQLIMSKYKLDDEQAEYLMDFKIRYFTTDNAKKKINNLKELREELKSDRAVIENESERAKIIYEDQESIINKYGTKNRTSQANELTEDDMKKPEVKISDELVTVVLTRDGFLRRLTLNKDIYGKFVSKDGDPEIRRWSIKNNQYILVFDRFGTVHKILVDSIDASTRAQMTDKITKLAGIEKLDDIVYVDSCGDYTGYFNLIYLKGDGIRISYDCAYGKRMQYKSLYKEVPAHQFIVTKENQFFAVTNKNKATYCDISMLGQFMHQTRRVFKVGRVASMEYITKIVPIKEVPCIEAINLEKYSKDYPVSIGHDVLWKDEDVIKRGEEARERLLEEFRKNNENSDEGDSDEEDINDNMAAMEDYNEGISEADEANADAMALELMHLINQSE